MGDEELNFTDEEARCWADDPHNQAHGEPILLHVILSFLLILGLIVLALVTSSRNSSPGAEQSHIRPLSVWIGKAYVSSAWGPGSAQH